MSPRLEKQKVLVIGSGHLADRLRALLEARGLDVRYLAGSAFETSRNVDLSFDAIAATLGDVDLGAVRMVYLVDDRDERNLGLIIALVSIQRDVNVTASLFNENIAPHLRAANPNIRILNPAKIAAPAFIDALEIPRKQVLKYTAARRAEEPRGRSSDGLVRKMAGAFGALIAVAIAFFHFADGLSWLDALYFVVVTVATVGYGDINLMAAGAASKLVGIGLILGSTFFIWMIFSLTVDSIIKKRVQLALGRKRYNLTDHVILCGLGRLGYFVAEGLLARGERVLIIEHDEGSAAVDYFRRLGADVYLGDARLPKVLDDARASRAKALYSVINNDYTNLEIGLNARSFKPDLRLVLRIFDDSMSRRIKENLDIHLTFSMTAIAGEPFLATLDDR